MFEIKSNPGHLYLLGIGTIVEVFGNNGNSEWPQNTSQNYLAPSILNRYKKIMRGNAKARSGWKRMKRSYAASSWLRAPL